MSMVVTLAIWEDFAYVFPNTSLGSDFIFILETVVFPTNVNFSFVDTFK